MRTTGLEHLTDAELLAERRFLTLSINAIYSIPIVVLFILVLGISFAHAGFNEKVEQTRADIAKDKALVAECMADEWKCTPAIGAFIALKKESVGKPIGMVNRAVNQRVRALAEENGEDVWQSPITTLKLGTGDCEDYAILKSMLFEALGYDTFLIIVWNSTSQQYHMLLGVNVDKTTLVLDNRRLAVLRLSELGKDYELKRVYPME